VHLNIYLTLKCNLRCPYCVNKEAPWDKTTEYGVLSATEWLRIIQRENRHVSLTGGEPTLYQDFYELANEIPPNLVLWVYSNMTFDPNEFAERVHRPVYFLCSIHPSMKDIRQAINCVNSLIRHKRFSGIVHLLETPENKPTLAAFADLSAEFTKTRNWRVQVDPDQRLSSPRCMKDVRRSVICANRCAIIAPDGCRYPCVTRMIMREGALENLRNERLHTLRPAVNCRHWGFCTPCDGALDTVVKFVDTGKTAHFSP
jgi:organic radical activating enzyme